MACQCKGTVRDATQMWVDTFNEVQIGMIEALMEIDPDAWEEVTPLSIGDRVYVYDISEEGEVLGHTPQDGVFLIRLDNGDNVKITSDGCSVERDDVLPMWGYLWSFGDSADDYWLEELGGLQKMADCGFRIYKHDEWGYFFGIDGAGYSFMEEHWVPLYIARGLQWHDPATVFEVGDKVFFNGEGGTIEDVKYGGGLKVKLDNGNTVDANSSDLKHAEGEYAEKPVKWFGKVRWCEEDIVNSLARLDVPVTEENICVVRMKCEHHVLQDRMIEAGWEVIDQFVSELREW